MDKHTWLYMQLEVSLRPVSDRLSRLGLLSLFGAYVPNSQEWVNSIIRQYVITGDFEVVQKAIKRGVMYLQYPENNYWIKREDMSGNIVEESGPFALGSFPAEDKEAAELLTITKIV